MFYLSSYLFTFLLTYMEHSQNLDKSNTIHRFQIVCIVLYWFVFEFQFTCSKGGFIGITHQVEVTSDQSPSKTMVALVGVRYTVVF